MPEEKDRQIAELQKQLDAAKAAQPSGWAGLFSLVGTVVNLVPRWLVISAGIVFLAWVGFELYNNAVILADRKIQEDYNALIAKGSTITVTPQTEADVSKRIQLQKPQQPVKPWTAPGWDEPAKK